MPRKLGAPRKVGGAEPSLEVAFSSPFHAYAVAAYVCTLNRAIGHIDGNVDLHPLDRFFVYPVRALVGGGRCSVLLSTDDASEAIKLKEVLDEAVQLAQNDCLGVPTVGVERACPAEGLVVWESPQRPETVDALRDAWVGIVSALSPGMDDVGGKIHRTMDQLAARTSVLRG